jgi:hypothetical protein
MLVLFLPELEAQCPMCRMSVESNLKDGGSVGKGLNYGILYLLTMPYLMVGLIGYVWWRHQNKTVEIDEDEEIDTTFNLN